MTLPARERDGLERKLLDLVLQIKSIAAAVVSAQRAGPRSGAGHILTTRSGGCGASPPSELFSAPAANKAPAGGGLCGALGALLDAAHSHRRSGEKKNT